MKAAEIAKLLGVAPSSVSRYATRASIANPRSPGDALALMVLRALDGSARFAEGARKTGEALDAGYPPAYLMTRGGTENVVVIESESPSATDEMLAALLLQANDAGAAVRVVKLRPMVATLQPWLAELIDA